MIPVVCGVPQSLKTDAGSDRNTDRNLSNVQYIDLINL